MRKRRRAYRPPRRRTPRTATPAPGGARASSAPIGAGTIRVIVCGVLFATLVTLKLTVPGGLAKLRGTLGSWLVRDADFASAFSAVGRAVSGEDDVLDSLGDAYAAVFGASEATEVAGRAEIAAEAEEPPRTTEAEPAKTLDYPPHAVAEQRVLGFDYAAPLQGKVTSGFGWREHPDTGREAFHYGIDIAADEGTEIHCFADGTVGIVADSVELGRYVTVHHENGVLTLYAHCSSISVSSGDRVCLGDKLGAVGSTGNATGAHLHFEIHKDDDSLDPAYYLS